MAAHMRVCSACSRYTLQEICAVCGAATISPHPMRYSPEDRYGRYRRELQRLRAEEEAR